MAKLIAMPAADGGKIWLNPDAVAAVTQYGEKRVQVRLMSAPFKDIVYLAGNADEVAGKLNSVRQREPV